MRYSLLVVFVLSAGCGATASQLKSRAAFDLHCNESSIRITKLDSRTRGVTGCGQRATYIESCDGPADSFARKCTWVLNSDSSRAR